MDRRPTLIQTLLILAALFAALLVYGATKATAKPDPLINQQRHLVNPGFETTTLFQTNEDLSNGITALSVGDHSRATQLARRGNEVPSGTSVIVLTTGKAQTYQSAQVRLLDGSNRTGWVTVDKLAP